MRKAPYRLLVAHNEEEIEKMLEADVMEPDNGSAWASPILTVKKKTNKLRLCTDFCKVNAVTKTLSYPVPHQTSIK